MPGPSSSSSPVAGPSARRSRKVKRFAGHRSFIEDICYSPDGKQIATGGWEPPIRIWDSHTGKILLQPEGHAGHVTSMCYSPDSKRLVSGDADGTVYLWDTEDGDFVFERLIVHSWVIAIAYSLDNQHIATGGRDCRVLIWRAEDLTQILEIEHPHQVPSVNFSPDGSRLATGCIDKKIRIFNVETGTLVVGPLEGHTGVIHTVTYSPNGEEFASCSYDRTVRTWDASTGTALLGPLEGHLEYVSCVVYSPDGGQLISGSSDHTIRIWDSKTGRLVGGPVRGHHSKLAAVSFAPDGTRFVSGADDGSIRVWDAYTRQVLLPTLTKGEKDRYRLTGPFYGHLGHISAVAYFPDGNHIASASVDGTLRIWDVQTGKEVTVLRDHGLCITVIAISSDGRKLVGAEYEGLINIWDTRTGDLVLGIEVYSVMRVKFSPDDQLIATSDDVGRLMLWDSETGEKLRSAPGVVALSFSPDGSRLAAGGFHGFVGILDVSTLELVTEFDGHDELVHSVAFSPDGLSIVSGSDDCTVRIWDATTGATILGPLEEHTDRVTSVSYSPDGTRICGSSDYGKICVWHAATGHLIFDFFRGPDVLAVFSPDGRSIVARWANEASDWKIGFLDAATGEIIQFPIRTHNHQSNSSVLDLPATHVPAAPETQPVQQIALGSFLDPPATVRPVDSARDDGVVRSAFFSFTRLRSAITNMFYNSPSTSDAVELQERRHRWTSRPIRTAYTRMKTFVVIASKSTPREQVLRDVSEEGSTGDGGGSQRRGPGVGENVTSTQPASVVDASGAPPAEAPASETPQNENQQDPPSIQPSSPYVAPDPADRPRITFAAGSVESEDSFEADCCPCCCLR